MSVRHSFKLVNLGRLSYKEGLSQQQLYLDKVKSSIDDQSFSNYLLAVEHNPVYTVGIRSKLYSVEEEDKLVALGADFHRTSRGGLITFHGPGQLVLYPIFNLRRISPKPIGVRVFVQQLEKAIIRCASKDFGIENVGITENTGVWVDGRRKLAAIGIAVSHGVSYHGIALNCNTDLTWFDNIAGCGIEGLETTSLSKECQRDITIDDALQSMVNSFSYTFDCHVDDSACTRLSAV